MGQRISARVVYPPDSQKKSEEGVVTDHFEMDRSGNVSNISIKKTSGFARLDAAAIDAVKRGNSLPALGSDSNPGAAKIIVELPINFALN